MRDLDETDLVLLSLLQRDGRTPLADLAKSVGLAVSTVNDRVRKLAERGTITGVHARVDPEALGLDLLAMVFVGWSDPAVEPRLLARVAAEPAILECHHITGQWNYLLKVRLANTRVLEAFLAKVIKSIKGIERTETLIVLSSPKEISELPVRRPEWG